MARRMRNIQSSAGIWKSLEPKLLLSKTGLLLAIGMEMEIVRMSSKGQVVIPKSIRDALRLEEQDEFVVSGARDAVVLKKVARPTMDAREFERIVSANEKQLAKAGYADAESVRSLVDEAISGTRASKR